MSVQGQTGVVVIGRNEGERLHACLLSIPAGVPAVYVDSGSTDNSVRFAQEAGLQVIALRSPPTYSAARARNAGFRSLLEQNPDLQFVMFVDGDCEIAEGWLEKGTGALLADASLALVFGRRRERFATRSIYNALCDDEWNSAIGEASTCGGDILCRVVAVVGAGGYRENMIAGEDPDFACRLRAAGWRLCCIDEEMTIHDAAILKFAQWWRRTKRGGHALAELAFLHPRLRLPNWRRQTYSIIVWGMILPIMCIVLLFIGLLLGSSIIWAGVFVGLFWPIQLFRLTIKRRDLPTRIALANSLFLLIGKVPQLLGMLQFHRNRIANRQSTLIEYKSNLT